MVAELIHVKQAGASTQPPANGPVTVTLLTQPNHPITVWFTLGSPMNPAGAAGKTAGSHLRNGPILVCTQGSIVAKLQGNQGVQATISSNLVLPPPIASATTVIGP